jgi:hypothetical protein
MEKDLVQKLASCSCSSVEEARKVLLKASNAVLSHRQIGKIEAAWLILDNYFFSYHLEYYNVKRNPFVSMLNGYCSFVYFFTMS